MGKAITVFLTLMLSLSTSLYTQAFVDDFAKRPEVTGASISPTGEFLAVEKEEEGKRVLAVFEYPAMKLINVVSFPGKNEVGDFWWVNNERLVISVAVDLDSREDDVSRGELYAVNADGKRGKYLFGLRGNQMGQSKSRVQKVQSERAGALFLHERWQDEKNILIEIVNYGGGFKAGSSSALLDVYTGRVTKRLNAPTANAQLVPDPDGNVRFSFYVDDDQTTIIHYLNPETDRWEEFSRAAYGESQITPQRALKDGRILVTKSDNDGPEGLYRMDPKTQKFEEVYQDDTVDIQSTYADWSGEVYALGITPDYRQLIFTNSQHPSAQLSMALADAFPDGVPVVLETTHDFNLSIVGVVQDTRTPARYIFDRKTNQLRELFDSLPWINDARLPKMQPITVQARDGLTLHGYLTVPVGAEAKNLPLIVTPHGGPHGPRDFWGFQWFEGFVPANGYALLQINFRGSGGYGMAFERKGYKQWGKAMQDDVTDATLWAIKEGIADPDRICIFGWSYGGYAALMGVVKEPDLYKCAVGGAGVYDVEIQYDADFAEGTRWGRKYLEKVIGDKQAQDEASSVYFVDKIKAPVLLIHGDADQRVPIEQAYALQKAYRKAGRPEPELIKLRNEPHSPRNEDNLRWMQKATIEFFEKHIGKGLPIAP